MMRCKLPLGLAFAAGIAIAMIDDWIEHIAAPVIMGAVLAGALISCAWQSKVRADEVAWSVSKSWTSNLTAVTAILGTMLSAGMVGETGIGPYSQGAFVGLFLLFGSLLFLAPLAWGALRPENRGGNKEECEGTCRGFWIASGLILWAAFGTLVTVVLGLWDTDWKWVVTGVALVTGVAIWFHTIKEVAIIAGKTGSGKDGSSGDESAVSVRLL